MFSLSAYLILAAWDEARAIKELFWRLYELWPDCPMEIIVGDSAWDEEWACEFTELLYGVHGIFRLKPSSRAREYNLNGFDSEYMHRYTGEGLAFCRDHKAPLDIAGFQLGRRWTIDPDTGARIPLAPGDPSRRSDFRVRFRHGKNQPWNCGKPSLGLAANRDLRGRFAIFPFYPHHMFGFPDRHAFRLAMLARRNACETLNSSLKVGNKAGNQGAARIRLEDYERVRMLISIALTMKTAFALAEERTRAGEFPETPPPPLDRYE